jgi:hypothetical protein
MALASSSCVARAGGDAWLHDRWSIGIGGHLNPGDGDLLGGLRRVARGDVASFTPEFQLLLLNDERSRRRCIRVVYRRRRRAPGRHPGERQLRGAFATLDEVRRVADGLGPSASSSTTSIPSGHGPPTSRG